MPPLPFVGLPISWYLIHEPSVAGGVLGHDLSAQRRHRGVRLQVSRDEPLDVGRDRGAHAASSEPALRCSVASMCEGLCASGFRCMPRVADKLVADAVDLEDVARSDVLARTATMPGAPRTALFAHSFNVNIMTCTRTKPS